MWILTVTVIVTNMYGGLATQQFTQQFDSQMMCEYSRNQLVSTYENSNDQATATGSCVESR